MKEAILIGQKLSKTFAGGSPILQGVDVKIYQGDFTVIMGSSGAGKSTLLYTLSGMDSITSGTVTYKGQPITGLSEKKMAALRAREFGFVFQQTHLVSNLTLFENVSVAGYLAKKEPSRFIRDKTEALLRQMGVWEAKDRFPAQVSGGEAQRAAIARAMIGEPGLLFADEPTGALNRANTQEVLGLLTSLNREGQAILMVTHDMRAAVRGNRILYLEDGKILDELMLDAYEEETEREREEKVSEWLSSLQW